MRAPYTQLYLHLVWSTWDRLPLLVPEAQSTAYDSFRAECEQMGAEALAIGGMPDHVHLLVHFPTTISVAGLVKQVKGASSRLLLLRLADVGQHFKWQGGYGAFTVSRSHVARVRAYIADQERHHAGGTLQPALERSEEEDDTGE